ncbi:MAG: glycosyltransferase [Candidatus Parcubacteria bacterium]|nr:glycosyltransferase [Candidatus Parcubacteria bacterium]
MNSPKLNIIMFNMSKYSDWQKGIANRNYHVLHNLVKNDQINKVIAVDFLPFTWKRAIKNYFYDQVLNDTRGDIVYGDLTSRCWQVSSKILVYSTIDSMLNKSRIITELKRIIAKEGMEQNLVVWNYNPMYADYLNKFENATYVFDAVDDWLSHSSYKQYEKILRGNYEKIKARSDLIFTVSEYLRDNLFTKQSNVHWLPNAVDLEFFQAENKIHPLLEKINHPIIGFLGILQDRINLDLIESLAKNNPEKSIVLAGPAWKGFPVKNFCQYKNVHFLGLIKSWEIPSLYNGFDVGIIPYKTNKFIKSTDPMKYYEYLAANLPVVSTSAPGSERFGGLVAIANTPEQFNGAVEQALAGERDTLKDERIKMLENNIWQVRVGRMLELINDKVVPYPFRA